jgi:hypothetical protein
MSVSHQSQSVSLRARAAGSSIDLSRHDVLCDRVLRAVIAAGRRGAEPATVTQAIVQGWQWLASRSVIERRALQAQLRDAIAQGHTTARAWLPLAMSETDPELLRAAVVGYLGSAPRSVEQRGQALDDVIEWFRRGLTLDSVAVFVSLLVLREPGVNERLASLRGRLNDAERDRALREFAGATDTLTCEFIAAWCGEPAITPAQPD